MYRTTIKIDGKEVRLMAPYLKDATGKYFLNYKINSDKDEEKVEKWLLGDASTLCRHDCGITSEDVFCWRNGYDCGDSRNNARSGVIDALNNYCDVDPD
jgi:hypothetical protein